MLRRIELKESPEDIERMQRVLDESYANAGSHLRGIATPERLLSAQDVIRLMGDAQRQFAMATVTAAGEPRVAPIDGFLLKGRFYVYTDEASVRARHLRKRPGISIALIHGDDYAVYAHGTAELINRHHPRFSELDTEIRRIYESSISDWSEHSVFIGVDATRMFTYAAPATEAPG